MYSGFRIKWPKSDVVPLRWIVPEDLCIPNSKKALYIILESCYSTISIVNKQLLVKLLLKSITNRHILHCFISLLANARWAKIIA